MLYSSATDRGRFAGDSICRSTAVLPAVGGVLEIVTVELQHYSSATDSRRLWEIATVDLKQCYLQSEVYGRYGSYC